MSEDVFFRLQGSNEYNLALEYVRDKGRQKGIYDEVLAEAYVLLEEQAIKTSKICKQAAAHGAPTKDYEKELNISSNKIDRVLDELEGRNKPVDVEDAVKETRRVTIGMDEEDIMDQDELYPWRQG